MDDSKKTLFELKDDLLRYVEGSKQYKYYSELIEKRTKLLETLGTPYFEEIKQKTGAIQKILKDNGYKDIDLLLKSLFIDGIKFFLNLDYQIRVDDNIRFDDYFLGLFDSLKINIRDKKLLNEILSELESGGEKLPESPLEFLINHDYSKSHVKGYSKTKGGDVYQENANTPQKGSLERIIEDFWRKDYGFIRDLRNMGVEEDRLEYVFLVGLHRDICELLNGKKIKQGSIDKVFDYYNIDSTNKELLELLKEKIELRFSEVKIDTYDKSTTKNIIDQIKGEINMARTKNNRLAGKEIMQGHCAFDDSADGLKLSGEDVIIYHVGDDYVPCDNHGNSQELLNKINSSSEKELENMYMSASDIDDLEFRKGFFKDDHSKYIMFLKQMLLIETIDIVGMYNNGDSFEVIKATYNDKEIRDDKEISCWYVDVRSNKTGKIYRVLSD